MQAVFVSTGSRGSPLHSWKKSIEGQIIGQLKTVPQSYFDDCAKLVSKTLNLNSFYLTPEGVVLYFQQYDIAPYAAGFPEFEFGVTGPFMI